MKHQNNFWVLCSSTLFFNLGVLSCFVLYWVAIQADYVIALKIANVAFENTLDDGYPISHLNKMTNPTLSCNMLFAINILLWFICGVVSSSKMFRNFSILKKQKIQNETFFTWCLAMAFLLFINLFPIAFIQGTYSIHGRLCYVLLILYFSFIVASIICLCIGRHLGVIQNMVSTFIFSAAKSILAIRYCPCPTLDRRPENGASDTETGRKIGIESNEQSTVKGEIGK